MDTPLFYNDARLGKTQPRVLKLRFGITGAAAAAELAPGGPYLWSFGAITQAQIDSHLGSEDEIDGDAFDSTAMGADVFGVVVNMGGQVGKVLRMVARCYSASNTVVTRECQVSAELTASSLTTEIAKTSEGNIGLRVVFGNSPDFDGLTAGTIEIDIEWIAK